METLAQEPEGARQAPSGNLPENSQNASPEASNAPETASKQTLDSIKEADYAPGAMETETQPAASVVDAPAGQDDEPTAEGWLTRSFVALGAVCCALPQDAPAPILDLYRDLRAALIVCAAERLELYPIPDAAPPPVYRGVDGTEEAVENMTEARPYWKAAGVRSMSGLYAELDVDAPERVWETFTALKRAVSQAKPPVASF